MLVKVSAVNEYAKKAPQQPQIHKAEQCFSTA